MRPVEPYRILFVHHSVGRYIIQQGRLRELLCAFRVDGRSVELWDHDYNKFGLSDGEGNRLGRSFPVPNDNTDPDGLRELFRAAQSDPQLETALAPYQVVMAKSCYPNNAIKSDAQLASLQETYRDLFSEWQSRGSQSFVLLTSPPLVPLRTTRAQAARAIRIADWLVSTERPSNCTVFDLFGMLADGRGMLKREYRRRLPIDAHPNEAACIVAAEALSEHLATVLGMERTDQSSELLSQSG